MKRITAIFETPEQATMAARRVQEVCAAKRVKVHSKASPEAAYRTGPLFSDFFVPPPQFNPGGDVMYPETFNFAALNEQDHKREQAIRSAKALVSLEVAVEQARQAEDILRNMGGNDVNEYA